ncbi:MAG: PKD domain-containing protein, partial [Bacteroidales bacterium]|nr:PKD domain-containing protein [Bacteroidales bacterium]
MKKSFYGFILTFLFLFGSISSFAQISFGGTPPSFLDSKIHEEIDMLTISAPDMQAIMLEDAEDEKNGTLYKVARLVSTDININNSGTWTTLENGREIWRLHIKSKGARGLALHFDRFNIPIGSKLFVYSPDKETVLGSFTSFNNLGNDATSIGLLPGEELIVEYVSPNKNSKYDHPVRSGLNEPDFQLSRISYIYRGMDLFGYEAKYTDFGASESCQVNVNCSEGANWQNQKKGVAHIYVVEGYYGGFCSGSLVNNTANDGTPYFLTADHCGGTATTNEFNQWIFRFNYEASGCSNPSYEPNANSITGCTRVARGPLHGASDFLLLELKQTPPASYGVVYNGWNRVNSGSPSGVSIHHPAGDIKKISTYTSTLTSMTYNGQSETGATNAHWRVTWTPTANGHGVTEGGSSGSPIFDNNGRIVGTLSGGSSYCSAPNNPDLYGKFYYHWNQYGSSNANKLQPWLDPSNTGATTLDFFDPNNASLNANFTGSPTTVVVGNSVSFTNTSSGNPTSYSWSFSGGSPSSSSSPNPTITYNTVGTYNVSLTVSNGSQSDTETKTGYITVVEQGTPVGFSLDFEAASNFQVDNFSPWTTYDGDQAGTYGSQSFDFTNAGYTGSFIAFNHALTDPPASESWQAHGGQRCGICFAATEAPNNDWLISPKVTLANNGKIKFWAKSITDQYGLERFNVLVSTTNNNPSSFTKISSGSYVQPPTNWTEYEYSLSAYNGQDVYVAIQCVS